jgi:predicted amidohydrolase YtcJ
MKLATPTSKVVDLNGRRVIPGLNDSHLHWNSVQPPTTRTHCGAGVLSACSLSKRNASATDGTVLHLYASALLNRAALDVLGFNKDTPDPPGGKIVQFSPTAYYTNPLWSWRIICLFFE